jgi:hypothetical protein
MTRSKFTNSFKTLEKPGIFLERRRCEMTRNPVMTAVALSLMSMGGLVLAQEFQPEPIMMPSPVQVIQPEVETLDRPVILEVQINPSLGMDTSMRILCATTAYRGEVHEYRQDTSMSLSVSGVIKELPESKIFLSFDVEVRSEDVNGGKSLAASGGAMLNPGEPKSVLTIGGRSLFLTVRFPPEDGGTGTGGK